MQYTPGGRLCAFDPRPGSWRQNHSHEIDRMSGELYGVCGRIGGAFKTRGVSWSHVQKAKRFP